MVGIDVIVIASMDAIEIASVHVRGRTGKWKEFENHPLVFPFLQTSGNFQFRTAHFFRIII